MAVTNTTSTATPCQTFYHISLNEKGLPIPGTMMARSNNQIADGYICREARLPPYQMSRVNQCFPDNGLRYFYRYDPITRRIIPNSFFQQRGKPKDMCGIYEFVIYNS